MNDWKLLPRVYRLKRNGWTLCVFKRRTRWAFDGWNADRGIVSDVTYSTASKAKAACLRMTAEVQPCRD